MRVRGLVVSMLVAAGLASAGPAIGQTPGQDSAVGDPCWNGFLGPCVDLDARSGPQGENPVGFVDISARQNFAGGPVTCLTTTGNRATVGFAEVFRPGDGFDGGFLFIEDNSSTGAGPDNVVFELVAVAPTVCRVNTVVYAAEDSVVVGDAVVTDTQPFPTSKDQCKNGGWRNYGATFQNQGQCNLFVKRTCGERGRFEAKPKQCPARLPNR